MVLGVAAIVFLGVFAIGNPVDVLVPPDATESEIALAMQKYGLDQPLWRQFLLFLWKMLNGDLSNSFVYERPALQIIFERFPATFELASFSVLLSIVIGIPLGIVAGARPSNPGSRMVMSASILGFSIPTFWLGLMLIMLFSVYLSWLPTGGRGETVRILGMEWSIFTLDGLRHLLLPGITLSISSIAVVIRLVRSGVAETLQADFVRFAHAKGLSEARIMYLHVLKAIIIPIVTVVGLDFGSTIAFAIVVENIFAWPGMGKLIVDSINSLDRPVVVAYLITVAVMFVVINMTVDIIYMIIDPRVRRGKGR